MPLGLPSSPTLGQQWPVVSPVWEYDGTKWFAIAGTGGAPTAEPYTSQGFQQPLTVALAGDSIAYAFGTRGGDSPLAIAAAELYPCEYEVRLNSAVGGTSTSHLISAQIAQLEALTVKPDVVIVQTIQNDYMGTVAAADTAMAYLIEYSERALAAGVKLVVLCSRPPKSSVPDVPSAWYYLNRRIDRYCRNTPGNYHWDTGGAWRATGTADTSGVAWRTPLGGIDVFSLDGTHPTMAANRSAAQGIVPVLQRFARPLSPMVNAAVPYDDATGPYNNLLGIEGLMIGTSGRLNGALNAGVAGSADDPYQQWAITAADGITATPSIVIGADGYRYQQIALSGTATADTTVLLNRPYFQDVATGTFIGEAVMQTNGLTGVKGLWCALGGVSAMDFTGQSDIGVGTSRWHFRTDKATFSNGGFSTVNNSFGVHIASGKTVSGNVQIGRVGVFRIN